LLISVSKGVWRITTSAAELPSRSVTWSPRHPLTPCMTMYLPGVAVAWTLASMNLKPRRAAICTSKTDWQGMIGSLLA
jgi:hypothetical protein